MAETARLYRVPVEGRPQHVIEENGRTYLVEGTFPTAWTRGREIEADLSEPLAPIVPGKIVAIGRNYQAHAEERAKPVPTEPMVFLKPPSSVIGPRVPIVLPSDIGRIDYEAELALVVGRRATRVSRADARSVIAGLTCVNDVTARGLQDRGFQFSHAKGYDTFCPVGPCVLLDSDTEGRSVEGILNGVVKQSSTTASLIFPVDVLIEYITRIMTLEPGDLIATGTPSGISPLSPGDVFTVRVSGVGELTNPVVG